MKGIKSKARQTSKGYKKTAKNIIFIIASITLCVTLIPIIIFNTILSIKSASNPKELPTIFGVAPTVVMSGSMEPIIKTKDLIFIKQVDINSLRAKEDIICFEIDGAFIVHRIERIEDVDGQKRFYTKGDANDTEDKNFVLAEKIQGKYVGRIAWIGGLISFLQTPYGILLVVILLVILYVMAELLIEYRAKVKENKKLKAELECLKKEN